MLQSNLSSFYIFFLTTYWMYHLSTEHLTTLYRYMFEDIFSRLIKPQDVHHTSSDDNTQIFENLQVCLEVHLSDKPHAPAPRSLSPIDLWVTCRSSLTGNSVGWGSHVLTLHPAQSFFMPCCQKPPNFLINRVFPSSPSLILSSPLWFYLPLWVFDFTFLFDLLPSCQVLRNDDTNKVKSPPVIFQHW